jgi:hypothetical protein
VTTVPPRRSTGVRPKHSRTSGSRKEVIRMLRKMFSLGALVVVAVTFGVANASAAPKNAGSPAANQSQGQWTEGFSDGRD